MKPPKSRSRANGLEAGGVRSEANAPSLEAQSVGISFSMESLLLCGFGGFLSIGYTTSSSFLNGVNLAHVQTPKAVHLLR